MPFRTTDQASRARALVELTPGRCQAIDVDGKRCRFTWAASLPLRRYCARCRNRLNVQRHRARAKNNTDVL